jgi:sigma-B regulation protein RsbU (phosphoserine phosphatase)
VLLGIDASSGELILTNGGHPPPLWYQARRQRWRLLQEAIPHTENELADLPLGAIPGTDYHQIVARLEPGDLVLAYSDGLSDVRNPGGELLQPEGLLELARRGRMGSPAAVGRDLLRAVDHYRGGASRTDDETLMVFERLAAAA